MCYFFRDRSLVWCRYIDALLIQVFVVNEYICVFRFCLLPIYCQMILEDVVLRKDFSVFELMSLKFVFSFYKEIMKLKMMINKYPDAR